jgi:peptide/nickel transport system permease protein
MRADRLLRRMTTSLIVIVGVVTLTFFAARVVPSDPAQLYAGPRANAVRVAEVRARFGLDRPLPEQFVRYVGGLLAGEFGDSFKSKRAVADDLRIYLPATLELVLGAYALAIVMGVPLGVLAGAWGGGVFDRLGSFAAILGASVPVFWLALLAQQLFFNQLGWLPLNGRLASEVAIASPIMPITGFHMIDAAIEGNWVAWRDALAHLVLPALVLAVYPFCIILRMTRDAVVETMQEPYILAARSRGLPGLLLLRRHVLRVALLPVLTVAGLSFAYAITGSVLVELLFRWPGIGKYLTDAIVSRDFPPILAVTLVSTIIFVAVTAMVDVLRLVLDPRGR